MKGSRSNQIVDLRHFMAGRLDRDQVRRWREFAEKISWSHYQQDPAWAGVERRGSGMRSRQPFFFWSELDGVIALTALGVRRRLPVPGRVFWEFSLGPLVCDGVVLDDWLSWLCSALGREAARVRVQPAAPLDEGGDDFETLLERQGFVRRRAMGGWTTLLVDIGRDEDEILASFRAETRSAIRKSARRGTTVSVENTPQGWSILSGLEAELERRVPVLEFDEAMMARIGRFWLNDGAGGTVLVARHDGEPVAAALVIVWGTTAYLPLIPSSRHHKLPTSHPLVWEAIRWARQHGCLAFDLVGYSMMARPGDSLWGINQFKRGFASIDHLTRSVAIHEKIYSPVVVTSASAVRWTQRRLRRGEESSPASPQPTSSALSESTLTTPVAGAGDTIKP
jgi:hypothetical protein